MGKYFDAYMKQLQEKKKKKNPTISAEAKANRFAKTYKPPYSFSKALGSDIGTFMASIPKIPGALWNTVKQTAQEQGGYDMSLPLWKQGQAYKEKFPTYNDYIKQYYIPQVLKKAPTAIAPFPLQQVANMPYVDKTKFGQAIPDSPMSGITNKLILESMIKNTGKWVYNPEAKGRKWLPKISEPTSRFQELKARPFSTALEDITNLSIVGAPIMKATGLSAKLGNVVKETKLGQVLESAKSSIKTHTEFNKAISEYNRNNFLGKENILTGKLSKYANSVPIDLQEHLFRVAEGTELLDVTKIGESWLKAKSAGVNVDYNLFKSNFDNALNYIQKISTKETNYLVKKGILTAEQADKVAWQPAVKSYLIKTGRYTADELENMIKKGEGFAKTIGDDFDIAVAEMEQLGYKKPVYMPHQFEKYFKTSDFYKQQPIYKKTPSYLKTRAGFKGYSEEPFSVWTRHEMQTLKVQTTERLVNKIIDKWGKPLAEGEMAATGYKVYYPEGFLKNLFTKNPLLKAERQMQIPAFMADELNKIVNAPGTFEKLLRATVDPITRTWKVSVLALSPRWLFNNFMGNIALNVAGAVFDPMAYINSFKKLRQASKYEKELGISRGRAMAKVGIRSGVADTGILSAEMRSATRGISEVAETSPIQNMFGKALNYTGLPQVTKGMYRINRSIENFFRTAHYLDKIGKGFSPARALESVNEFLFDYGNLSSVERNVIRRIVPFYSWQKNITRLVVSYPFKYPQRMAVLQKLQKLVTADEKEEDIKKGFLPDYLRSYVETPTTIGGEKGYLSTRGLNPFADVGAMTGDVGDILSSINPMLKLIIERGTKTNLYKGRSFTSPNYNEERPLPALWRHILSQVPQYNMIQNLRQPYAKYDTGEPILDKTGKPKYPTSKLLTILKMFGINISPFDLKEMKKTGIEQVMKSESSIKKYEELMKKFKQSNR